MVTINRGMVEFGKPGIQSTNLVRMTGTPFCLLEVLVCGEVGFMKKKIWRIFWLLPVLALVVPILLVATDCGNSFSSNGQGIYFTAESASEQPITYSGGPGTMMQSRLACVTCHGPEGHGGTVTDDAAF